MVGALPHDDENHAAPSPHIIKVNQRFGFSSQGDQLRLIISDKNPSRSEDSFKHLKG